MILRYDKQENRRFQAPAWRFKPPARLLTLLLLLFLPLLLAAEYQTYTVKAKDTLYSISKKYGVTVDQIKDLNGLKDNSLKIDQVLKIKETAAAPKPVVPVTPPQENPSAVNTPQTNLPITDERILGDEYYYTVQAHENLYRIAVNHALALNDLLKWNGFENDRHIIHPGDRLIVKDPTGAPAAEKPAEITPPPTAGTVETNVTAAPDTVVIEKIYIVQKKDTLYHIAKENGMTVEELKKLNNLSSNEISVGQKIYLAGNPPEVSQADAQKYTPLTDAELQKSDKIREDLFMPANGTVTSEYGLRNGRPHKGIDIAGKTGTPIYSVLDGVVVYSGVQGGYGNVVVIEHPDFVMTVYGHNERNVVKVDDHVKKGQLIAYMGASGNASGTHLHFEYRLKGKAINPRKVLKFN